MSVTLSTVNVIYPKWFIRYLRWLASSVKGLGGVVTPFSSGCLSAGLMALIAACIFGDKCDKCDTSFRTLHICSDIHSSYGFFYRQALGPVSVREVMNDF